MKSTHHSETLDSTDTDFAYPVAQDVNELVPLGIYGVTQDIGMAGEHFVRTHE